METKYSLVTGGKIFIEYNKEQKDKTFIPVKEDFTNQAHTILNDNIDFSNCIVGDIYALLSNNKILAEIYKKNFVESFLTYLAKLDKVKMKIDFDRISEGDESIESIVFSRTSSYNPVLQELYIGNYFSVVGRSKILKKEDCGVEIGERIDYSVIGCPIENLYFLPIKFDPVVISANVNPGCPKDFKGNLVKNHYLFKLNDVTLNELIQAITWELSFFGSPEDTIKENDSIKSSIEQLDDSDKDADEELKDFNERFNENILKRRTALLYGFEVIPEGVSKIDLNGIIKILPNNVIMGDFVKFVFGDSAKIFPLHNNQTVYDYRLLEYDYFSFSKEEDNESNEKIRRIYIENRFKRNQIDDITQKIIDSGNALFKCEKDNILILEHIAELLKNLGYKVNLRDFKKAFL